MIASSHVAGKQQESETISKHRGSNLIFLGLDRGGGDTYLGIRNGNRSDGNQAKYCFPLGTLEDASEDYDNFVQTFYQEKSIVDNFQRDFMLDAMHTIEVLHKKDGAVIEAQCAAVRFVSADNKSLYRSYGIDVTVTKGPDIFLTGIGLIRNHVSAEKRERASAVTIPTLLGQESATLVSRLLFVKGIGCVGFTLHLAAGMVEVHCFVFERPFGQTEVNPQEFKVQSRHVKGFPSHDGKCCLLLTGQATANCSNPCLHCIMAKQDFSGYQMWMHRFRPTIPAPTEEAPLREGRYSGDKCYDIFIKHTGNGGYSEKAISTDNRKEAKCVVRKPLAVIDPHKENGGPMHISSGLVDHLITDTRRALREIDQNGDLVKQVELFKTRVENFLSKEPTDHEKRRMTMAEKFESSVDTLQKRLATAAHDKKREIEQQLRQLEAQRYDFTKAFGFGAHNKLRNGATEVLSSVVKWLSACDKQTCGEAEFVFNKAIELTGVEYRREHGGLSLSNAHSIKVMEKYILVAEVVENTYVSQPDFRKDVVAAMKRFRVLAEPCFHITVLLKGQGPLDDKKAVKLKKAVCDFSVFFREQFPGRPIYLKLHWLECMTVRFGDMHGFIGWGSEEGFESAHNRLRWIKVMLKSMPVAKDRGEKMGQRYQVSLLPGAEQALKVLHPPKQKRGTYKKRSAEQKESKRLQRLHCTPTQHQSEYGTLLQLPSQNLILDTWKELFELVAHKVSTAAMQEYLIKNTVLSGNEKLQIKLETVV